jgi:FKBP-type peptidyl-prolyl cis-trans isomerase FkpA
MRLVFVLTFIILVLFSCKSRKYKGFRYIGEGFYYSLVQIGDKAGKSKPGDFLTVNLSYKTIRDSSFFRGTRKFRLKPHITKASLDYCFSKLNLGDSIIYLIPAKVFFEKNLHRNLPVFFDSLDIMKMEVRLLAIQTAAEYEKQKQDFLEWAKNMKLNENAILSTFLRDEKISVPPVREGFYIIPVRQGKGRTVKTGDHLWIRYKGKFLNGEYFDEMANSPLPVDFIYGTRMFLIEGLDRALSYMTEGEKAMVILPSSLAFGQEGSATGLVPPFTSLIYELELIRIE